MRLLLSTAVIVVLQKASQGCMNASNMLKLGGSRNLEPSHGIVQTRTRCGWRRRKRGWHCEETTKTGSRSWKRRKKHGKRSNPKRVGWDGKSGCDAGIGPHRKAGSEDDVLDSTLNRVKAHLPARGEVGCQGVAGDSMQDPFRVQRRLLGVSSVRRLARKRMHKYLLHCGWESPGQGRLRYTRRDHE